MLIGEGKPGPGRPKGSISLTTKLKQRLAEHPEEADAIVDTVLHHARAGDVQMIKLLWDRHDGPVAQKIEVALNDEMVQAVETAILEANIPDDAKQQMVNTLLAKLDEIAGKNIPVSG